MTRTAAAKIKTSAIFTIRVTAGGIATEHEVFAKTFEAAAAIARRESAAARGRARLPSGSSSRCLTRRPA